MTVVSAFDAALAGRFSTDTRLGVAVSGGSDSTALLHLAAGWAARNNVKLRVATVDHRLRAASADEARQVSRQASALDLAHHTLDWTGAPVGNLQNAAREARKALLGDWARRHGLDAVLLGHTATDQAETVLLRLARGSGVDGLAGMTPQSRDYGVTWLRPLLEVERAALRAWLKAKGIEWRDDPGNDDPTFDRVRARQMADALADLGLTSGRLGALAGHMERARHVLDAAMVALAGRAAMQEGGDLILDRAALTDAPADTRARLLARAMMWVSGNPYRPRFSALQPIADRLGDATLHGTILRQDGAALRLMREAKAVAALRVPAGEVWDGRWRLVGAGSDDLSIAALGQAGLGACPDWRGAGLPAMSLAASPAVWRGADLVAAPLAGMKNGWSASLVPGRDDFHTSLPSH